MIWKVPTLYRRLLNAYPTSIRLAHSDTVLLYNLFREPVYSDDSEFCLRATSS